MNTCPKCHGPTIPLFTSYACKNECDLRKAASKRARIRVGSHQASGCKWGVYLVPSIRRGEWVHYVNGQVSGGPALYSSSIQVRNRNPKDFWDTASAESRQCYRDADAPEGAMFLSFVKES